MRAGRLTAGLLGVTVAALLLVPPMRVSVLAMARCWWGGRVCVRDQDAESLALADQNDATIWLGLAEVLRWRARCEEAPGNLAAVMEMANGAPWLRQQLRLTERLLADVGPPAATLLRGAYERAAELAPNDPTPKMRLALFRLAAEGRVPWQEPVGDRVPAPEPRTADQDHALKAARRLLLQGRRLEPDNAAWDYLLACTHLADHTDAQAWPFLLEAIRRPRFSFHDREAALAVLRVAERVRSRSGFPAAAAVMPALDTWIEVPRDLRGLAYTLSYWATRFRARGDHARAIQCYEATIHLGRLWRVDAYSTLDVLNARRVTAIAHRGAIPDADLALLGKGLRSQDRQEFDERAEIAALCSYLAGHGRGDLADLHRQERETVRTERPQRRAALAVRDREEYWAFRGGQRFHAVAAGVTAGMMLAVGFLAGLLARLTRQGRERRPGPRWGHLAWLVLLGLAVLPGQLAARHAARTLLLYEPEAGWDPTQDWAVVAGALGVGVWLVAVFGLCLLMRRRQPREARMGVARAYLSSLRALAWPTVAALILATAVALWPMHRYLVQWDQQERQMLMQGEAQQEVHGGGVTEAKAGTQMNADNGG